MKINGGHNQTERLNAKATGTQEVITMKSLKLTLALASLLAGTFTSALGTTITWDGGGGDLSWQNPLNWSGDQVPGSADDAVINVPTNVAIVCNGTVTVRSVQCQGGLLLSGGDLTVTAGSSFIDGTFILRPQRNLTAQGSGVVFAAKGPTVIEGSVSAYGAAVVLANATSLVASPGGGMAIGATSAGVVDLSGVTNVVLDGGLYVFAFGGSRVDLRQAQITGYYGLNARAREAGSVVDLSALSGQWGTTSLSTLSAEIGGAILIPNVTDLTNVDLQLYGTNGTPTGQLRSIRRGTLTVQYIAPDFSNLTNVEGCVLSADYGATLNLSNLTSGADFQGAFASGGAVVLLTNLTSLVATNRYLGFSAGGPGGLVDLSNVTNVTLGNYYLNLSASAGGRVDLRRAAQIAGTWTWVQARADGAGSVVDLSALSGEWGMYCGAPSSFEARNGGAIQIPNVTALTNVSITLGGTNGMPIAQLRSIRRGVVGVTLTVENCAPDFSNLTNVDGCSLAASIGATLDLKNVKAIADFNGASASGNAVLRLTNLTSLVQVGSDKSVVSYGGGLVDLSRVTQVVVGYYGLAVSASGGGRVDLSRAQITGYKFSAGAYEAGSVVDLSALTGEWGTTNGASLTARDGGTVWIPNVTGLTNVSLYLHGTNGTPISQLRSIRQGTLDVWWITPDLSSLTNADGSYLVADYGAVLNLRNMRAVAGLRGVSVSRGAALVLTNVTSLVLSNNNLDLSASGGGGLVDLSRVTNLVVMPGRQLNVAASSGGRADLQRVESITGGSANFLSDGTGTVIDLSRLSGFLTPLGASSLKAQNGGVILINSNAVFLLANVAVTLPGLIAQATPAMVLHGQAWHSYWVEQRDTRLADSPWQFLARVPQTNEFQTFAPAPPANTAFRVAEFVADPAILDLNRVGGEQVQLVLYGAPPKSFEVQTTNSFDRLPAAWGTYSTTGAMTNSFRLFPPFTPTEEKRFYRGKEL